MIHRATMRRAASIVGCILSVVCSPARGTEAPSLATDTMLSVCEDESSLEKAIAEYLKTKKGWGIRYQYADPNNQDLILLLAFGLEKTPSLRVSVDTFVSRRDNANGSVRERVISITGIYELPVGAKGERVQAEILRAINRWHMKAWAPGRICLDNTSNLRLQTAINIPGNDAPIPAEMVVDAITRMAGSWKAFYEEELRRLTENARGSDARASSTTRSSKESEKEVPPLTAAPDDSASLEAEARRIALLDNRIFKDLSEQVFAKATALEKANKIHEAEMWYELGLGRFVWDLQHQLEYAGFLLRHGKPEKGRERAGLVAAYAEDPNMRRIALSLIDPPRAAKIDFKKMEKVDGNDPVVVLVPVGTPEPDLIASVRADLERLLGVRVIVQSVDISIPAPSRDRFAEIVKDIRRFILSSQDSPGAKLAMNETGITIDDLGDEAQVVRLYEAMTGSERTASEMRLLRAAISRAKGLGKQWDASKIIEALKDAVKPYRRDRVAYVAITDFDIHAGEGSNFVFAHVDGKFATVSYRRFKSDFLDSLPNRKRLAERLLTQCLSASANTLGVERCSCLSCPYAAARNLEEHDLRTTEFCSECRAALKKLAEAGQPRRGK